MCQKVLAYWYNSTYLRNTLGVPESAGAAGDIAAGDARLQRRQASVRRRYTQFTSSTGTKVQKLTELESARRIRAAASGGDGAVFRVVQQVY